MDKILKAIKNGSKEEILIEIRKLKPICEDKIALLLKECPDKDTTNLIIDELKNPIESKDNAKSIFNDNSNNSKLENLNKKYSFNNSKYDKAVEMLFNCFKVAISPLENSKAQLLCVKIVESIISQECQNFPKIVRSKCHNLKENIKLARDVYEGKISPKEFVKMGFEEMQREDIKIKDKEYIKDSLLASQMATAIADTEIFICSKCKQRKCTYFQLQTRSCDEPMTTFVTCTVCGNKWKF